MSIKFLLIFIILFSILGCESRTTKKVDNSQKEEASIDTKPPILKLKGKKLETIYLNQKYIESGFSAYDNRDGDITSRVEISGLVDSSKLGRYRLKYIIKDSSNNIAIEFREVRVTTYARVKLGSLKDEKVDIFKFEPNNLELKWSEEVKDDIFDTHADELEDNTTYLYRIKGGVYQDLNSSQKENFGKIELFIQKKYLEQLANSVNITALSQLSRELTNYTIKYSYTQEALKDRLNLIAKELIIQDINSDEKIDFLDILSFNPDENIDSLSVAIKDKLDSFRDLIYSNKSLILNLNSKLNTIKTDSFARSITKSKDDTKLYIADGDAGITVVDIINNSLIKSIKTKDFVRKIALNKDESIAYVADSKAGFSIIDLSTNQIVANIPTYEQNSTIGCDINSTNDCDVRDVVIKNSRAYIAASSRGIMVIDISTPNNPTIIKTIDTPDIAYAIKLLDDTTALVADGESGVLVIDLESNATISRFDTYGSANSIRLSDDKNTIYISDGYKGVVLADISDISNPTYKNHITTADFASDVTLNSDETKAYISDRKGNIQVVDLTQDRLSVNEHLPTNYRSYSALLSEDEKYLFVASGVSGLTILPTKTIKNPAKLSKISTWYKAYNSTIKDNYLYIAQGYKGLVVFDISNPKEPKYKSYYDTKGLSVDVITEGNYTYIADGYKGLLKLDTSNLESITKVDSIDTDGFASSLKFIPNSNKIILSDGDEGVKIVDKDSFTILETIKTDYKALDIKVNKDGDRAYIALGKAGVLVVNLNNYTKVKTIQTQDYVKRVELKEDKNLAYTVGENGIKVIDLNTLKVIDFIEVNSFSSDIKIIDTKAFVATQNGVEVISLKTKESLGVIDCGDKIRDIKIKDNIAYISASSMGMCIVDLELLK